MLLTKERLEVSPFKFTIGAIFEDLIEKFKNQEGII